VHGTERILYEMAYNYIAALHQYSANPDVEVFVMILDGHLPIDAQRGQQRVVETLRAAMLAAGGR
jgi:hypothetical protein